MSRNGPDLLTVAPQMVSGLAFAATETALKPIYAPLDPVWLRARLREGLQIRMLRRPDHGLVLFCPGQMAWRPIQGAAPFVVVHDLRVLPGPCAAAHTARLWRSVEEWACYFGYAGVVALSGDADGFIAPERVPPRHYTCVDDNQFGARLIARVLRGPVALPRLPRDWTRRAAGLGSGVVVQCTGETGRLAARAERVLRVAERRGVPARVDCFDSAAEVQARAGHPAAVFAVYRDGVPHGGPETTDAQLRAWIKA